MKRYVSVGGEFYRIDLSRSEEGGYLAVCREIPGAKVITEGDDEFETRENARDAIRTVLQLRMEERTHKPKMN